MNRHPKQNTASIRLLDDSSHRGQNDRAAIPGKVSRGKEDRCIREPWLRLLQRSEQADGRRVGLEGEEMR